MIATLHGRGKLSSRVAPHLDVLVTGATGFAGTNVARVLVADGYRVRVLARPASSLRALEGCGVEVVRGDTLEPDSVAAAIAGCGRAGVERVICTSSVGTLGLPREGRPGTETTPVSFDHMIGPYQRSKFLAERVAEEYAARGLPVVIVNPAAPRGPMGRQTHRLWHRLLRRSASESATLCHGDGSDGQGDRRRRSFVLPILSTSVGAAWFNLSALRTNAVAVRSQSYLVSSAMRHFENVRAECRFREGRTQR
jgi:nucleoside-diphosphate-sugar epimerase